MSINIAIVGATGNVGRCILSVLAESTLSNANVVALASEKSVGKFLSFGGDIKLETQGLASYDFGNTDIAIFSAGSEVSKIYAEKAAIAGCVVIDNTSYFRMEEDVPLVIPEINPEDIAMYHERGIIANPNCSTIQMLVALYPLHMHAKIKRIVVSTYQSVSGAGKLAMDELFNQSKGLLIGRPVVNDKFTKQIAFNCIPHIDVFMDDGYTKEEWKMSVETKKILHDESVSVVATCVRVPVFVGHSATINVEFHNEISEEDAFEILHEADGVLLMDRREDGGYTTPVEVPTSNEVYISRLRQDTTVPYGLTMWIVSDNLRRGAAFNSVRIAEILADRHL